MISWKLCDTIRKEKLIRYGVCIVAMIVVGFHIYGVILVPDTIPQDYTLIFPVLGSFLPNLYISGTLVVIIGWERLFERTYWHALCWTTLDLIEAAAGFALLGLPDTEWFLPVCPLSFLM